MPIGVFIRQNCKQWGNKTMEQNLENLYSSLDQNQGFYPLGLAEAAEQYKMRFCKARKNGNNNRNNKSDEDEKEGDEGGQAMGLHFEVENEDEDENEEEEEVTARVTELLGFHDDEYDITDNDDISLASTKS